MRFRLTGLAASLIAVCALAPTAAARSTDPQVRVTVIDSSSRLVADAPVRAAQATVPVGDARCAVGAGTALAALAGIRAPYERPPFEVKLFQGACSGDSADAGGLYVASIARQPGVGSDGWVYKVGHKLATAGAADPAGPFGAGPLRAGDHVLWFWCRYRRGGCQRTLEVVPRSPRVASGGRVLVTVRAYDDAGRGSAVRGATVRLDVGGERARTNARGRASLTVPAGASTLVVSAARGRLLPAVATVRVG